MRSAEALSCHCRWLVNQIVEVCATRSYEAIVCFATNKTSINSDFLHTHVPRFPLLAPSSLHSTKRHSSAFKLAFTKSKEDTNGRYTYKLRLAPTSIKHGPPAYSLCEPTACNAEGLAANTEYTVSVVACGKAPYPCSHLLEEITVFTTPGSKSHSTQFSFSKVLPGDQSK